MKGSISHLPARPRRRNCRGAASVKVVVALPVLLMFTWLSVEIGLALRAFNQAKIASDAISLAAAARYRDGFFSAAGDAVSAAVVNDAPSGPVQISIGAAPTGAGGDVEFGRWNSDSRSFEEDPDGGPAVRVTVRFAADNPNGAPGLVLPGLFTPDVFAIERSSVAVYTPPKHITSVLVDGKDGTTLSLAGSGRLVTRGGVAVGCDDDFAVSAVGGSLVDASFVRIEGAIDSGSESAIQGSVEQVAELPEDPFAEVAIPAINPALANSILHNQVSTTLVQPGVHRDLTMTGGVVVLQPGLHQFIGGISLSGNAELRLSSATIQLADGVGIEVLGDASIFGTSSTTVAGWSRYAVIQRSPATWSFDDSAVISVAGDLYAPQSSIVIGGSTEIGLQAAIVGTLAIEDQAVVLFDGSVEPLETDPVPGRARLVR